MKKLVVVAVKTEIGGNCQQECPNIINDWEDK